MVIFHEGAILQSFRRLYLLACKRELLFCDRSPHHSRVHTPPEHGAICCCSLMAASKLPWFSQCWVVGETGKHLSGSFVAASALLTTWQMYNWSYGVADTLSHCIPLHTSCSFLTQTTNPFPGIVYPSLFSIPILSLECRMLRGDGIGRLRSCLQKGAGFWLNCILLPM